MDEEGYTLEQLLDVLRHYCPIGISGLEKRLMRVEHGLLSVGLKLHAVSQQAAITELIAMLGEEHYRGRDRLYRRDPSAYCCVLPPCGNASSAIRLIECIEQAASAAIFNNPGVQIQICSPGRLESRYAALLSIAFYLGSDILRGYDPDDFATTFSHHPMYPDVKRGKRITIYDGNGDLDRGFAWWGFSDGLVVHDRLPFYKERTDVLTGATRVDIRNVNLVATLLVHAQHSGYWEEIGRAFAAELEQLLHNHLLQGILEAPWIRTNDESTGDDRAFFIALQELIACAYGEYERMRKSKKVFGRWRDEKQPPDILSQMRQMLQKYRDMLICESWMAGGGEP